MPDNTEMLVKARAMDGRYYAEGSRVLKAPKSEKTGKGQTISLGFPVCDLTEYVGSDGAEFIAEALNRHEAALALQSTAGETVAPELRLDRKDPHCVGLDDMELAVRARALLEAAGCATLADILLFGRGRMARVRGCGPAVLKNIEHVAATYGYGF